jgi:hypothetical protein
MKVKGSGTHFGVDFGRAFGRGGVTEGLRLAVVRSVRPRVGPIGAIVAGICACDVTVGVVDVAGWR